MTRQSPVSWDWLCTGLACQVQQAREEHVEAGLWENTVWIEFDGPKRYQNDPICSNAFWQGTIIN